MDIEEWELLPLPDDEFLELHNDKLLLLPIELNLVLPSPPTKITTDKTMVIQSSSSPNQYDSVSQEVFFKKGNEFVDMKLHLPRSSSSTMGTVPPFDAGMDTIQYKIYEKNNLINKNNKNNNIIMDLNMAKGGGENTMRCEEKVEEENGVGRFSKLWSGVGAICSVGVATAATICIVIFNTYHKKNNHQHNHKLQFQIYTTDDKRRIKQVRECATKLNELAISVAMRGVPFTRAHFTVGGSYDHAI